MRLHFKYNLDDTIVFHIQKRVNNSQVNYMNIHNVTYEKALMIYLTYRNWFSLRRIFNKIYTRELCKYRCQFGKDMTLDI